MRRVVVTGMAGLTSLGEDWPTIKGAFSQGRTGIRFMEDWARFTEINTRLAAPVLDFSIAERYPRKKTRTMGRVSQMAVYVTELALRDAGLFGEPVLVHGRTGVAYGS
ncbi:MAG TPA: beta-ketoacyl synthase N-terminal-like domain-containing protein, partial [Telmatospirillum sp.]|nr:beta-ketoacyl synthase N-terminal-like domain-containing protein [Telmatospirillum sp.]